MCQVCGHRQATYRAHEPTRSWPEFALGQLGPLAPSAVRASRATHLAAHGLLARGFTLTATPAGYTARSATGSQATLPGLLDALTWLLTRNALRLDPPREAATDWATYGLHLALSRLTTSAGVLTLELAVRPDGSLRTSPPFPTDDPQTQAVTLHFAAGAVEASIDVRVAPRGLAVGVAS
ncbi:hypothetical protein JT358_05140 [Micrococcales bacterium 31B]|nr:hypothetical protein [Micrococcales bacterium 31B]